MWCRWSIETAIVRCAVRVRLRVPALRTDAGSDVRLFFVRGVMWCVYDGSVFDGGVCVVLVA